MSSFIQYTLLLLITVHSATSATLDPVSIPGNGETGICPDQEERDAVIHNISASVRMVVKNSMTIPNLFTECGSGEWYRVAHLNMSDSSQQCPSVWREYDSGGVRACGRPQTSTGSCPATFYPTSRQYSRVCGRVIGHQIGSTDAFGFAAVSTIESYYVYGVSVTHGTPRNHIWTLASGYTNVGSHIANGWECPCFNPSHSGNVFPPSFVGNNYYCESGNPTDARGIFHHLYSTDPLWDGEQCEGECCSNGKSPPWFSVELPNPTTDDIEVRICVPEGDFDDVAIHLLELYVQ